MQVYQQVWPHLLQREEADSTAREGREGGFDPRCTHNWEVVVRFTSSSVVPRPSSACNLIGMRSGRKRVSTPRRQMSQRKTSTVTTDPIGAPRRPAAPNSIS
eukprot:scaffold30546_cov34-Tisochrysis_lutea.AAC.3